MRSLSEGNLQAWLLCSLLFALFAASVCDAIAANLSSVD